MAWKDGTVIEQWLIKASGDKTKEGLRKVKTGVKILQQSLYLNICKSCCVIVINSF